MVAPFIVTVVVVMVIIIFWQVTFLESKAPATTPAKMNQGWVMFTFKALRYFA
jgi:hypothetical protein